MYIVYHNTVLKYTTLYFLPLHWPALHCTAPVYTQLWCIKLNKLEWLTVNALDLFLFWQYGSNCGKSEGQGRKKCDHPEGTVFPPCLEDCPQLLRLSPSECLADPQLQKWQPHTALKNVWGLTRSLGAAAPTPGRPRPLESFNVWRLVDIMFNRPGVAGAVL